MGQPEGSRHLKARPSVASSIASPLLSSSSEPSVLGEVSRIRGPSRAKMEDLFAGSGCFVLRVVVASGRLLQNQPTTSGPASRRPSNRRVASGESCEVQSPRHKQRTICDTRSTGPRYVLVERTCCC